MSGHRFWDARQRQRQRSSVSASKDETILLSASGDVLTCRCRDSIVSNLPSRNSNTKAWKGRQSLSSFGCCESDIHDLSTHFQQSANLCNWGGSSSFNNKKYSGAAGGLLGGAPAKIANIAFPQQVTIHKDERQLHVRQGGGLIRLTPTPTTSTSVEKTTFRSRPVDESHETDEERNIVPIRSFDYSHFDNGGNDMAPQLNPSQHYRNENGDASFLHGVPTFLPCFQHVKITQVSAHPLGSHVLFISTAGLLYSVGLNQHGQLGIGVASDMKSAYRGYVTTPTIVTPLVENGGKAIACAAGVDHSLVVVATEERRVAKTASLKPDSLIGTTQQNDSAKTFVYHQVYGFGRNNHMKIGLVSPKENTINEDSIILPRRVGLRCKVRPDLIDDDDSLPPQGIFDIQASAEHSAALVRRGTGDVELYTWGNASRGALGLPESENHAVERIHIVPVPCVVPALSKMSRKRPNVSKLLHEQGEYIANMSLGRYSTFVVTSLGRCFSFGTSGEGMMGLGPRVVECKVPTEIVLPSDACGELIRSVSAGGSHVLVTSESGAVFAWGADLLPNGLFEQHPDNRDNSGIQWSPCRFLFNLLENDDRTNNDIAVKEVCAGHDASYFVTEAGHVLACGKNTGRLGLGEMQGDIREPRAMFGGLCLWQGAKRASGGSRPLTPNTKELRRGFSVT
jgi:alpha-tubulin suppressor-like RCC1 family protein